MSLEECKLACLKNCTCTTYSCSDIRSGGSGCLLWFGDLMDMKVMHEVGEDIYIRMASSESGPILEEGQEVAVKWLSQTSAQGLDEFKNEEICITKLQHQNLVKLLGCFTSNNEQIA
ncbi:hypothetical protein ACH5RR_037754 [Cinchona calisaya]|uniref:Apple domain-containing protein n=1 Tax=Cinchona calisaya TaxID=153742 RepID=A0ABD2YBU7_9GENT